METLRLSADVLEYNGQATFAEVSVLYFFAPSITCWGAYASSDWSYGHHGHEQAQLSTQYGPSVEYVSHFLCRVS